MNGSENNEINAESAGSCLARRGWFVSFLYHVGLDLLCLAFFALLFGLLLTVFHGTITFMQSSILLPLFVMLVIIVAAFASRIPSVFSRDGIERRAFVRSSLRTIRDWLPLVLIVFLYENFHDLTDLIRPTIVDSTLREADRFFLRIEPAFYLERFTMPWLTEFMTFAYALYFFYPTLILTLLYRKGEFLKFREFGLALSLCFYLGLMGYMLVPAIGPRYAMAGEFTVPLTGVWLTQFAADAWNTLQSFKRDCFPSLHTALSTVALIYLWRLRRQWRAGRVIFAVCLPMIVSLWLSTLYLRYHYGVDVIAGWLLAVFCCWAAPSMIRWYYRNKRFATLG